MQISSIYILEQITFVSNFSIQLANALVSSRLDFCNSLLIGIVKEYLHKLQMIKNSFTRATTNLLRLISILSQYSIHCNGCSLSKQSSLESVC